MNESLGYLGSLKDLLLHTAHARVMDVSFFVNLGIDYNEVLRSTEKKTMKVSVINIIN